jgi:DNA-binding transcriptional MerR regulator
MGEAMADTYQEPIYNLKSVVYETGVKPDTLRAWERRYGLPNPARTAGGHRLYSQRDIEIIKWLLARQREGLRIKRAVELWHSLEEASPQAHQPATAAAPLLAEAVGSSVEEFQRAWVSACLAFDERQAEQVLTQAFALYPPEKVCLDVLRGGVADIGEQWYAGHASVQQEHFATSLAMRRVEALLLAAPAPTRSGRIVAACPPEEAHSFGLLLLTYLLRRQGWDILYLGANVPIERLQTVTRTTRPSLVVSVALQLHTAATLLKMAQFLHQEAVDLAFGGRVFNRLPGLRDRIPGHFLGTSLGQASQSVGVLMVSPRPSLVREPVSDAARQALAHYREHQLLIEADLVRLRPDLLKKSWFSTATGRLARSIVATLTLGDIALLDDDIDWLEGMGQGDNVPIEVLEDFLRAYYRAAVPHVDPGGALVLDWLARRIGDHT